MRILITGGAGFLGSHLCERLIGQGHAVVCVDNFITGRPENVAHLMKNDQFSLVKYNVCDYLHVDGPLDAVMHFASPASPQDYLEYPIATLKVGALGTHKALGLAKAKQARFLLASTSEVYGDPLVNPQPESYWGNVNPISPRGVYDEAKRFAEAMTMAYHRYHGLDTRIVRIFNSVLADEIIIAFDREGCHLRTIEDYAQHAEGRLVEMQSEVTVPAFNPQTFRIELRQVYALIRHRPQREDAYCISARYGRRICVTGDHSVFRRSTNGDPEAVPVRELKIGDHIAIAARLPVQERDRTELNIGAQILARATSDEQLWEYAIESEAVPGLVSKNREVILKILMDSPRFENSHSRRNTVGCTIRKFCRDQILPLFVIAALERQGEFAWPEDARVRPYKGGGGSRLKNRIVLSSDVLWLLGFYLAEGSCTRSRGTYVLNLSSDSKFLERAKQIIQDAFGIEARWMKASQGRAPALYVHSKQLCDVFKEGFGLKGKANAARVPSWIIQLPLSRLKHFLEGYREGDGTHTRYEEIRELAFNTVSEDLATDLTYVLLRFGLVAAVGRYETTFRQRYGERKFPFWRITVCEVSNFDILTWDTGVTQTLNARRLGDLVWAQINKIERVKSTEYVYDFSVPGHENFLAGLGVFAHNTFGPRMRPNDGRVVSNFIVQALQGNPLTVFGDGKQTRSFCYVDDLVSGILALLMVESDKSVGQRTDRAGFLSKQAVDMPESIHDPVNLGNPRELTVLEIAKLVLSLTGSSSEIQHQPLPVDDPKVRRPDIRRAKTLLKWEPRVPLEEGLARTIEYFRGALGVER
jgi:nucleoside-diphosphate-sugar epimerase